MPSTESPFPATVHPYGSRICAYENGNTDSRNAVIFISGLSDGPHTAPFVRRVAQRLQQAQELSYSVFEIRLRSSFTGFGMSSIANDAADIAELVKYLRSIQRHKIVLYGHSTGCQDCMEYTNYSKHNHPPVDGFILQAPVSDREFLQTQEDYQDTLNLADNMIAQGKQNDCLPRTSSDETPMSAYRVHSLYAKGGDDDYFSSDLDNATVSTFWSRFQKPVLVLFSEKDEYVPAGIEQRRLLERYREANPVVSSLSGLIPQADHGLEGNQVAQEWLAAQVEAFLRTLEG